MKVFCAVESFHDFPQQAAHIGMRGLTRLSRVQIESGERCTPPPLKVSLCSSDLEWALLMKRPAALPRSQHSFLLDIIS